MNTKNKAPCKEKCGGEITKCGRTTFCEDWLEYQKELKEDLYEKQQKDPDGYSIK